MDNKCIIPWIHTMIETTGDVFPCCVYEGDPMGNIKNSNIVEIWNSKDYKNLRNKMLSGEAPEGCNACYRTEKFGGVSKRQRENQLRQHLNYLIENDSPNFELKYLDLRFSNICNFKCRYCYPMASHSISSEYKELKWNLSRESDILKFNKKNIIDILYKNIAALEEVYFCGGEPLLMEEHYDFLDKLIESKNTNLILRYSSNLSKLNFKDKNILDYWKHFSNVQVHASLDHYGSKLEYIRHGSDWNNTVKNICILSKNKNIELKIAGTISIFNVLDIPDIFETYKNIGSLNYEKIGLANLVRDPSYYNIQSLHPEIKKQVQKKLLDYNPDIESPKLMCKYVVDYMMSKDTYEENKEEFVRVTDTLDKKRKENFLNIFPELKKQIE